MSSYNQLSEDMSKTLTPISGGTTAGSWVDLAGRYSISTMKITILEKKFEKKDFFVDGIRRTGYGVRRTAYGPTKTNSVFFRGTLGSTLEKHIKRAKFPALVSYESERTQRARVVRFYHVTVN